MAGKKKHHVATQSSTSWTRALLGLVGVFALIWGLVELYDNPKGNLQPYNKFKKTSVSATNDSETEVPSGDASSKDTPETVAEANVPEPLPDVPAPRPRTTADLPIKTLQHISKGMGLAEQGKYELAELEFEKASQISPNASEVYAIWGAAHRMQGKFEGANKRFARAYELAPDDEEILFNWGLSRLHEQKADEAIDLFKKTLELDSKHYLAYNYLGKSYGLKKDYKHESEAYKNALKFKEDFAQAHFNLAVVLSLMKEFDEAGPHYIRAIELDKEFDKPFVNQFLVAMGLRQGKKANLKKSGEKSKEEAEVAKADPKPEAAKEGEKDPAAEKSKDGMKEGSHAEQKKEGSEGSDTKVVAPITQVSGQIKINGEPVGGPGLVILETKSKLKAPNQETQKLDIFQRGLQFDPPHSVVMVGSTVRFVNDDREVHNIFSKSQGNQFNLGAMAAGTAREIQLDQPGPVVLRCNLHKDMIGTLFVVPNGYYTTVDNSGHYEFENVKSQEYLMQFWHPRLTPEEVALNMKNMPLRGVPMVQDLEITSKSEAGEIHDMVDQTDYNLLVKNIEEEVTQAIADWKAGKKYLSHKRMLKAITYYYDGGGLKGAIAKSFSEKRSQNLESALDEIRKSVAGLKQDEATEAKLKGMADRAFAQLKNNVQELYARIKPDDGTATP